LRGIARRLALGVTSLGSGPVFLRRLGAAVGAPAGKQEAKAHCCPAGAVDHFGGLRDVEACARHCRERLDRGAGNP